MGVKGEATRARLITGTLELVEAQGYFGTGLNRILAATGAPRGSLHSHFPGGKDQLVAAALTQAGQEVEALLTGLAAEGADAATLAERPIGVFAERLEASRYISGCPIAIAALEAADLTEEEVAWRPLPIETVRPGIG
ncbi:TetR/AcrR family transcriptional regulator [Kitasatospora brasiliensis]|uniref:TetR/AcrR family transcriptional regulator n=1 Tax=Kitasatospora brasiliensis TaxID=3058040 RepID=UPI00292D9525|nr:TetR/AcrR family transcriptional regulator [Kitasatospora sp. K002]